MSSLLIKLLKNNISSRQGWTPKKMFEKADEFFQSMGMDPMPQKFWEGSILEKPEDGRELTCHASAWDFYDGEDFRIKQCTRVNQEDFITVNHEMGHIQYFLQYKTQPHLYRQGANPGFHEGVADILSLSVGTATYFKRIGLLAESVDIESLYLGNGYYCKGYQSLYLGNGWDVFSGETTVENMNCHWWKLRHEIQGLTPPNKRSYEDFDAGSKYHVANDVPYVRYFTAFVYEFQFYRALCLKSGKYVPGDPKLPLHRCNFYGSREAGDSLREMLKLGSSRPWKEAMLTLTGQPDMNTDALREYFLPLENFLKKENRKNNVQVGWGRFNVNSVCKEAPVQKNTKGNFEFRNSATDTKKKVRKEDPSFWKNPKLSIFGRKSVINGLLYKSGGIYFYPLFL
ncbi:angiotensin-converting enzyme [Eurytemora carolleeae]|uniref:angiotensin-converting enzyme n=1 Tax=Eurytemora carolleeae TaxID=1294199 RepID=UPI000C794989|nr:angiotensin-converting enzyme [Eurytemora carolleeae]|eukprot:XP_023323448.1 angiotensin-converting enzyme-like [Eurytemora affinis]